MSWESLIWNTPWQNFHSMSYELCFVFVWGFFMHRGTTWKSLAGQHLQGRAWNKVVGKAMMLCAEWCITKRWCHVKRALVLANNLNDNQIKPTRAITTTWTEWNIHPQQFHQNPPFLWLDQQWMMVVAVAEVSK